MSSDHKAIDNLIGKKIKARRHQLGLSQGELGRLLGVSAQQIQRYESGENTLTVNRLLPLANVLNVTSEYLLQDVPQPTVLLAETVTKQLARPLRILLVEDDLNDILLFEKALEHSGYDAEPAFIQKPEAVLERLNDAAQPYPDLILLDINLPRINGVQLLKKLKQSPHRRVPVVMLTNSIRKQEMLECYEHNASGFVQKSTDLRNYYADIERILSYWADMAVLPTNAASA